MVVLLIDDDDVLRTIARATLESAGHTVHELADGSQAEAVAAQVKPDLVITDLLMPNRDGIEVIQALRACSPGLPILAVSGGGGIMPQDDMLRAAKVLGASKVLRKPYTPTELASTVAGLLKLSPIRFRGPATDSGPQGR